MRAKLIFSICLFLVNAFLTEQAPNKGEEMMRNGDAQNDACFQDGVLFLENSVNAATRDKCREECLTIQECQVTI